MGGAQSVCIITSKPNRVLPFVCSASLCHLPAKTFFLLLCIFSMKIFPAYGYLCCKLLQHH